MKTALKTIIIGLLIFLVNKATASPQAPDLLIYKGDTTAVYILLVEQYLEDFKKDDDVKGELFGLNFRTGASFNCWRGYQAVYKIENDSLFLEHIIWCNEYHIDNSIDVKESKRKIAELFGDKVKNGSVFIDWYSGGFTIKKPKSKTLRWDGIFYTSFEEEILITVTKGKVEKVSEIENYLDDPERIDRRYRDTISNVIFEEIQKIKWKSVERFDCSESYLIAIDKKGHVKDVKMVGYETKEKVEEFWDSKREYNYCLRTLKRKLKGLKFDILCRFGKPVEENVYIEIWFNEDGAIENWTN